MLCHRIEHGVFVFEMAIQHRRLDSRRNIELVGWGALIGWVQKLAYREIDQLRALVERSVVARWHNDELPIRQITEDFGIFFGGGEVVVASHDQYRYRYLLKVGGFDHHGLKPHVVAFRQ